MSSTINSALNRHLAKLLRSGPVSEAGQRAFLSLATRTKEHPTYRDIVREGDPTEWCCFIEEGLVSRCKSLRNGDRQIVAFHIPGDLVDLQSCLVRVSDHTIRTHTPTVIHSVACDDILTIAEEYPELGRALWFDTLVDGAIFREWTLNVGRRTGRERTAHLLLEFAFRFATIGQSDGTEFVLPITQADLADAVGLSPVHLNRCLQALRADGLIRTFGKTIVIEDREAMVREADFRTTYLHPERARVHL